MRKSKLRNVVLEKDYELTGKSTKKNSHEESSLCLSINSEKCYLWCSTVAEDCLVET